MSKDIYKKARERIIKRISVVNGCWEWDLKCRPNGYARMTFMGRSYYAHRLSFESFNGRIDSDKDVCHSCDNRKCVNPAHLFQGTRKENMQDAVSKHRQAKGFFLPQSKLSEKDKYEVMWMLFAGIKHKNIAELYDVTRSAIVRIGVINGFRRNNVKLK